ncbi:MAG: carboxypeptidase regulatory-like domain-containing protein [Clostridia bacterium]|nr:carboxypeptidase regulatory-like domain-containing protein [Clostridia bacterium]
MLISGRVNSKNGEPISGALIEIKDESFRTIHQTLSDAQGNYSIDLPSRKYPFLTAVRDYGNKYLEYWCQNINLMQNLCLDIRFDTLEVYGLHAFNVKGAYPSLMLYFRPMSLEKFKSGNVDICPELKDVHVFIDSTEVSVLEQNKVLEFIGDRATGAYLLQVELPASVLEWQRLDIEITDNSDAYGMATLFADQ